MVGISFIRNAVKRQRLTAALLAFLLILPVAAMLSGCSVESRLPEGEIEYILSDSGEYYSVASCGTYIGSRLEIPAEYNGLPVKHIDTYAFAYNKYLEEVVLPESIVSISSHAFYHCINLKQINFPEELRSIHRMAFEGCTSLENVSLSRTVAIYESAFACCDKLGEINYYGEKPSGGCLISIISMELVDTTMVLNTNARNDDSTKQAFDKSPKITAIEVASENEHLASYDGVLYNKDLTMLIRCPEGKTGTLRIPATVEGIEYRAFLNCSGIEAIEVEEGNKAFKTIDGVLYSADEKSIYLCPKNCETLYFTENTTGFHGEFSGMSFLSNVKKFEVHPDNEELTSKDGLLLSKDESILALVPPARTGTFTVPEYIKGVVKCAFGFSSLSKIVFKSEVEGNLCFINCSSLESVVLPENTRTLSDDMYVGCTSLETVIIPASVEYIGRKTFSDCFNLKKVEFEDPEGWKLIMQIYGAEEFEQLPCDIPIDVSDSRMAAWYLQHAYWRYDWGKTPSDVSE